MVTWTPVANTDVRPNFATNVHVLTYGVLLTSLAYLGHKGNAKQNPQMLKSEVQ
jgi:hypothetical protein